MRFLTAFHSDVGIKKNINQDSLLIQTARTDYGEVLLSVVCDGMGGLAKGELASATVIRAFSKWFREELPEILYAGLEQSGLKRSLEHVVFGMNTEIGKYGRENGIRLGTTAVVLLIINGTYYIINIGDSRSYKIVCTLEQLTKDQTYVQREMDQGRMTLEQAKRDPQRNVLLQCIGGSSMIEPDFHVGSVLPDEVFMLCTDGFRNVIEREEMYEKLNPYVNINEQQMHENIVYLIELNKARGEEDNISALLIRTC